MTLAHVYANESEDPDCIDDSAAAELLGDAPWRRMVVVGDSIALGTREVVDGYRDEAFLDRVGRALAATRPGFAFANLAVHGARLPEIRDEQLPVAIDFDPDLAVVVGGGNDAVGRRYDAATVRRDLCQLVEPLTATGAFVVTMGLFDLGRSGILPPEYAEPLNARFDELDAITQEVAAEYGALHVDCHHHPRASDPSIFASDNMHANTRGHAIAFTATVQALAAT